MLNRTAMLENIITSIMSVDCFTITDACVNCGSCDDECAVAAISENDGKRFIDSTLCVYCGACVSICPVEAIVSP